MCRGCTRHAQRECIFLVDPLTSRGGIGAEDGRDAFEALRARPPARWSPERRGSRRKRWTDPPRSETASPTSPRCRMTKPSATGSAWRRSDTGPRCGTGSRLLSRRLRARLDPWRQDARLVVALQEVQGVLHAPAGAWVVLGDRRAGHRGPGEGRGKSPEAEPAPHAPLRRHRHVPRWQVAEDPVSSAEERQDVIDLLALKRPRRSETRPGPLRPLNR
jgi:hypothetical protein